MAWNWQHSDWPNWCYLPDALQEKERLFLVRAGRMAGLWESTRGDARDEATVDLLAEEAMTTSRIEGEFLNRSSVRSSLMRAFGLKADPVHGPAESGIADMMVDGYQTWQEPLSAETLHRWHRMVCRGRSDLENLGGWRLGKDPMQVVSGRPGRYKVHFEAPPADHVPCEMLEFINWYNASAPGGDKPVPALARAGLAHIHFIAIHPYEDGNGRIVRALCEKALAQAVGDPILAGLSIQIEKTRNQYYDQLERAGHTLNADDWLAWFGDTVILALEHSRRLVNHLIHKTQLLDRLRGRINDRQTKALLRVYKEGPEGFKGGLSAANYMRITDATPGTASRDLAKLVELGALVRTGERKGTRYWLADRENGAVTAARDQLQESSAG